MKKTDLLERLRDLDAKGIYILTKRDLEKLFPDEQEKAMEKSLKRMVDDGILAHPVKGVYVNMSARSRGSRVIEDIAKVLRPGAYSYLSLESMLSEYGVISQIPLRGITVMTTGASGRYQTSFGAIEFTHTKRSPAKVVARSMYVKDRPLRIATKRAAVNDLIRVGRNVNMIDEDELEFDDEEDSEKKAHEREL